MDKLRYLSTAPIYYAAAISRYWDHYAGYATQASFQRVFDRDGKGTLLSNDVLFEQAIAWLLEHEIIQATPDDFGPTIFLPTDFRSERLLELSQDKGSPLYNWYKTGQDRDWLDAALAKVNLEYARLSISTDDFASPDGVWEPLPLDREGDETLQSAINALDSTIEQVRADNGYNATLPGERNFVLDALSKASAELHQSAATTAMYLKTFALEPLMLVIKRYQKAALGLAAQAAKEILISWLKEHGVTWLDGIF